MDSAGLIMGCVVIAAGVFYLYMGVTGRWVYLKKLAEEEAPEEEREERLQKTRNRYRIFGVAGIVVGIAAVLLSTI